MKADNKDSPDPNIDKAVAQLLESLKGEIVPEEITAKSRAITVAITWQKVKHNIKDDAEFDANSI